MSWMFSWIAETEPGKTNCKSPSGVQRIWSCSFFWLRARPDAFFRGFPIGAELSLLTPDIHRSLHLLGIFLALKSAVGWWWEEERPLNNCINQRLAPPCPLLLGLELQKVNLYIFFLTSCSRRTGRQRVKSCSFSLLVLGICRFWAWNPRGNFHTRKMRQ